MVSEREVRGKTVFSVLDPSKVSLKERYISKMGQWRDLHKRQDGDYKLYTLEKFLLRNSKGRPLANCQNVTLNDPATFATHIIMAINKASRYTEVKSEELDDKGRSELEKAFEALMREASELYARENGYSLEQFLNEQICIRGRIISRNTIEVKDGKLIPEIMAIDSRFACWESGIKGVHWGGWEIMKSRLDIYDEFGITLRNTNNIKVIEVWDDRYHDVWVGAEKLTKDKDDKPLRREHDYGEAPFTVAIAPAGPMLWEKDKDMRQGESIFWQTRDLYPELNKGASIFQTRNFRSIKPAKQYKSKEGAQGKLPLHDEDAIGATTSVEIEGGFSLMPTERAINEGRFVYSLIESRVQRGSLSALDYGNLQFPLSAVAITKLTGEKDVIFVPRLSPLAFQSRESVKMLARQIIKLGESAEISQDGTSIKFTKELFDKNYEVFYTFKAVNPEQNIANYSVANVAEGKVSRKTIMRDILQIEHPGEEDDELAIERAIQNSPSLQAMEEARAFANKYERTGDETFRLMGELRAMEIGTTLDAILAGGKEEKPGGNGKKAKKQSKELMPLLGSENRQTAGRRNVSPSSPEQEAANIHREADLVG